MSRQEQASHVADVVPIGKCVAIFDWDKTMAPGVPPGKHFLDSTNIQAPVKSMVDLMLHYRQMGWYVCVLTNRADRVNTTDSHGNTIPKSSDIIRGYLSKYQGLANIDIFVGQLGKKVAGSVHKLDTFVTILGEQNPVLVAHYEDDAAVLRECSSIAAMQSIIYGGVVVGSQPGQASRTFSDKYVVLPAQMDEATGSITLIG
jgi:hypothetical protein